MSEQTSDNYGITAEILEQCDNIVLEWKAGKVRYQDALAQLDQLGQEARLQERLGDQGYTLITQGILQGWRGNYAVSIQNFESARDIFVQIGNRNQVVRCTLNIGESYRLRGNFTRARQYFNSAYKASLELNSLPLQVISLANEAQMLMSVKHNDQALTTLNKAYDLSEHSWKSASNVNYDESRRLGARCEICCAMSSIYLEKKDIDDAWRYACEALEIAKDIAIPLRLGHANRIIGEVLTDMENVPEDSFSNDPDEYFQNAVSEFRKINADGEIARTMFAQGKSLGKRGRTTLAARKLQQAMVIFTRLGMVDDAARAAEAQLNLL